MSEFRPSVKGERRGGRQKGTPNKQTAAVKQALQETFEGIGGIQAMIAWAMENQTAFYNLYGKLIPIEAKIEGEVAATIIIQTTPLDEAL